MTMINLYLVCKSHPKNFFGILEGHSPEELNMNLNIHLDRYLFEFVVGRAYINLFDDAD